jgi:multiple sugar transport system permease protein
LARLDAIGESAGEEATVHGDVARPESPGASRRRLYRMAGAAGVYLLLIVASALTLLPLAWSIAASFTPLDQIFKYTVPFSWHALFPQTFTLQAYHDLLFSSFTRALLNTIFVCAATVVGGIIFNSMAGFAFAGFEFPGKRLLFILVLVTFMVPFEVLALPLYVLANNLQLANSYQALILPALANGIVIFLCRQFFLDTPRELLDAARVDGLSWFAVYWRIVLPLSTPVLVSGGLVLFLSQWQSFFWPLLIANDPQYQVVQVALANFQGEHLTLWNDIFAGSVISMSIPVVLLLVLQRYYVRTIARTGLIE